MWGFSQAIEGMTFNFQRLVVKEYNTMFWAVVQIAVLCYLDDYLIVGEAALPALQRTLLFLVPWVALYLVVWGLKKSGRLHVATAPTRPSEASGTS